MKKNNYFIILSLLMFLTLCGSSFHKEYRNFKITNIKLCEVSIKESIFKEDKACKYFLLQFSVDYCNGTWKFFGGSIEPGLDGIIESIESIKIVDSNGNDITSLFHNPATSDEQELELENHPIYALNNNIDSLVDNINNNNRDETGLRITIPRLFIIDSIDSVNVIPSKVVLNIGEKIISNNVETNH